MAARWLVTATLVVVGMAACAPEAAPPAQQAQAPPANAVLMASVMLNLPSGLTATDLPDPDSQGARLVGQFCGQACHGIPAPSAHSVQDWPIVLRRMWMRMAHLDSSYQVAVPTNAERAVILDYMLANALKVTAGDLPDAPGKQVFVEKCAVCHGLPDVHQHSPEDWVAVVRRMNGRMEHLIGRVLSQDELQRIVLYLEKVSAGS